MRPGKATVPLVLALSLLSLDAQAISRYNSQGMTCDRVQEVLRSEGAAILRWRSKSNAPLYNRFVTHGGFCEGTEVTKLTAVPTSDNAACKVFRCIPKGRDR